MCTYIYQGLQNLACLQWTKFIWNNLLKPDKIFNSNKYVPSKEVFFSTVKEAAQEWEKKPTIYSTAPAKRFPRVVKRETDLIRKESWHSPLESIQVTDWRKYKYRWRRVWSLTCYLLTSGFPLPFQCMYGLTWADHYSPAPPSLHWGISEQLPLGGRSTPRPCWPRIPAEEDR